MSIFPTVALVFAVAVLSQAGNIIRLCDASPVLIAFYRLFFALIVMLPFAIYAFYKTKPALSLKFICKLSFMGVLFVLHFLFWIAAVQQTTVANAAIFFSTSPVFAAIGARLFLRERLSKYTVFSILLGLLGVIIMGFSDFSLSPVYFWGDILALLGGAVFAAYLLTGKYLRSSLDNRIAMSIVYAAGILFLLPIIAWQGVSLTNFSPKTWIGYGLLAIFPTILGHATMIYVMRFFKASTVSTATLIEPVLAGLVAWLAYGEVLSATAIFGYVTISGGLLLLFRKA